MTINSIDIDSIKGVKPFQNQSSVQGADILNIARHNNEVGCKKTDRFPIGCRECCTIVVETIRQSP